MEQLVYNFYNINEDDYLKSDGIMLSLWNAKYIIDILDPTIVFYMAGEEEPRLYIKDINNTDITQNTFTYYMQFIFLPKLHKYLNKQKNICRDIINGLFHQQHKQEKTYEEVSAHLKKYFNIDKDPRELVSIRVNFEATEIRKESWVDFLRTKKIHVLASQNDFNELRTWITKISRGINYESIHEYLLGRASFAEYT